MEEAFGVVVFVVVLLASVIAVATLVHRDDLYDQIGRGGLNVRDSDAPRAAAARAAPAPGVREEEIRQMLEAGNVRRARRGLPPLDVEDELHRLAAAAAAPDAALRAEVRQLVLARNERRARQGKPPLDVEAEVERQLRGA